MMAMNLTGEANQRAVVTDVWDAGRKPVYAQSVVDINWPMAFR